MKPSRFLEVAGSVFISGFVTVTCSYFNLKGTVSNGYSAQVNYEERVRNFIYHGFSFKLEKTLNEVTKNLGKPKKMKTSFQQPYDIEPYTKQEFYELFYNGLYVAMYEDFVGTVVIKSKRYKTKYGINVGDKKQGIVNFLGIPKRKEKNVYIYENEDGLGADVRFYFRKDTVKKMEWNFYVD